MQPLSSMTSCLSLLLFLTAGLSQAQDAFRVANESVENEPAESESVPESDTDFDVKRTRNGIEKGTNEFREGQQQSRLSSNAELTKAAQAFAEYLAETDQFDHNADGKEPWERSADAGYRHSIILENIAFQSDSKPLSSAVLARRLLQSWEESPPHRKNLLDPDVMDLGVGVAYGPKLKRYYAVQLFGRPKSANITFKITNRIDADVKYALDGKEYALPPRSTVTHERSRPGALQFLWSDPAAVVKAATEQIQPVNGAHYSVRSNDEGQFVVVTEK